MSGDKPTSENPLTFVIYGEAQPAGSKRGFVHPKTHRVIIADANPKSGAWKQYVAKTAAESVGEYFTRAQLAMELIFYRERPKSHSRSGKRAGEVRESAPMWPGTRPDTTKLLRAVEDGMQGVVYSDDAQIVEQHVYKRYGTPIRCEVKIWEVSPAVAGEANSLPLRSRDGTVIAEAIIDPDDYHGVCGYRWSLNKGYAFRVKGGKHISLHRQLMGVLGDSGVVVDHINRDTLDNRRHNLRVISAAENCQNRRTVMGSSPYRGVQWNKATKKWTASANTDGKTNVVGYFDNEIEAAVAAENYRSIHMPYAEPDEALARVLESQQLELAA